MATRSPRGFTFCGQVVSSVQKRRNVVLQHIGNRRTQPLGIKQCKFSVEGVGGVLYVSLHYNFCFRPLKLIQQWVSPAHDFKFHPEAIGHFLAEGSFSRQLARLWQINSQKILPGPIGLTRRLSSRETNIRDSRKSSFQSLSALLTWQAFCTNPYMICQKFFGSDGNLWKTIMLLMLPNVPRKSKTPGLTTLEYIQSFDFRHCWEIWYQALVFGVGIQVSRKLSIIRNGLNNDERCSSRTEIWPCYIGNETCFRTRYENKTLAIK